MVTNPAWRKTTFERELYVVVRYGTATKDHIPSYLEKLFGAKGYFCTDTPVVKAYGWQPDAACGTTG